MRHHKHKRIFYYGIVILLLGTNLLFWSVFGVSKAYEDKIPLGVTTHGETIGGLSITDAIVKLDPIHRRMEQQEMKLIIEKYETTFKPTDFEYTIDTQAIVAEAYKTKPASSLEMFLSLFRPNSLRIIPLHHKLNQEKLAEFAEKLRSTIPAEPKDIALDYQNNTVTVIPPEPGFFFEADQIAESVSSELTTVLTKHGDTITLPLESQQPLLTEEAQIANAKQKIEKIVAQPFRIEVEDLKFEISPDELYSYVVYGIKDNTLTVMFDETKIKSKADEIAKKVSITPIARKVYSIDNSVLNEGRDGRKLDVADTTNQIVTRMKDGVVDSPLLLSAQKIDRSVVTETPEYTLGLAEGKYIDIDLSLQRMNIIEGQTHIGGYSVSTGKWSTPTPIGEFSIKNHIRTAWSSRYRLYMPFWMAIQKPNGEYDGYGIHGLPYWPNGAVEGQSHIGRPASHGCIRLGADAIEFVYNWAVDGTKVFIHE